MTKENKTYENTIVDADLHEALSLSIMAILRTHFSASLRVTPEVNAEIKQRLADGSAKMALLVTHDGTNAEASLALIATPSAPIFTHTLLELNGPLLTAIAPVGDLTLTNLAKLN